MLLFASDAEGVHIGAASTSPPPLVSEEEVCTFECAYPGNLRHKCLCVWGVAGDEKRQVRRVRGVWQTEGVG